MSKFIGALTASVLAIFVCALIVAIPVFVYIATCWLISTVLNMILGIFGAEMVAMEAIYMIVFILMLSAVVDCLTAEKKAKKKVKKG